MDFDIGGFFTDVGTIFTGRRDRDHAEHRDDRLRLEDNYRQERLDNTKVQRMVADAKVAGLHPLSVLGANISSPVISSAPPSPMPYYPSFNSRSTPGLTPVDAANIKLLDKQADFIDEQISDARQARIDRTLASKNDTGVRLPGMNLATTDPKATAQDLENKYGEIAEADGALMRFLDNTKDTYERIMEKMHNTFGEGGTLDRKKPMYDKNWSPYGRY